MKILIQDNNADMLDSWKEISEYYIAPERTLMTAAIVSPAFAFLPVTAAAPTQATMNMNGKLQSVTSPNLGLLPLPLSCLVYIAYPCI